MSFEGSRPRMLRSMSDLRSARHAYTRRDSVDSGGRLSVFSTVPHGNVGCSHQNGWLGSLQLSPSQRIKVSSNSYFSVALLNVSFLSVNFL